jgi:hypothetical protein
MGKTMKTKLLVKEWKQFLNESAVVPLKLIKVQIKTNRKLDKKTQEKVFLDLSENWNKIYKKFSNVIFNDMSKTDEPVEHMLTAISEFSIYYNTCSDDIKQKVAAGTITSSELRGFVESKKEAKKSETRTKNRVKCRSKANLSTGTKWSENSKVDAKDFEVIYVGNDWTVVYPKTLLGSISWAVGLADGSEEKYEVDENGTQIGRVTWCTASYDNNRFHMYASDLHMYYFVKNEGYSINDIFRRLCISAVKNEEDSEAVLYYDKEIVEFKFDGGATVNADNNGTGVSSLEEIQSAVNNPELVDLIKSHASTKKVTSIEEMASRITLPILKQDEEMLANDKESLNSQIGIYLKYANSEEIIDYIIEKYKYEMVHLETIWDNGPLPLLIFERNDLSRMIAEYDIVTKLLSLYDGTEHKSGVFNMIIYVSVEGGINILNAELKDKMIDYQTNNTSHWHAYIGELILNQNMHKLLDLNDIVKILTSVANSSNIFSTNILDVVLQEFNFSAFKGQKEYDTIKRLIKKMYPMLDDRKKKKLLSNHSYVFESSILKKYIKLVLS